MTEIDKLKLIEAEVCDYLRVEADRLHRRDRRREICEARFAVFAMGRQFTALSYRQIGLHYDLDHATVYHGCNIIADLIRYNGWRAKSETLRARIGRRIQTTSEQIDMDAWCRAMGGMVTNYERIGI